MCVWACMRACMYMSVTVCIHVDMLFKHACTSHNYGVALNIEPADYTALVSTTVTIAGNTDSATFEINIEDDNVVESNETFQVQITSISPQGGIDIGTPSSVTVMIIDNDGE